MRLKTPIHSQTKPHMKNEFVTNLSYEFYLHIE